MNSGTVVGGQSAPKLPFLAGVTRELEVWRLESECLGWDTVFDIRLGILWISWLFCFCTLELWENLPSKQNTRFSVAIPLPSGKTGSPDVPRGHARFGVGLQFFDLPVPPVIVHHRKHVASNSEKKGWDTSQLLSIVWKYVHIIYIYIFYMD